MNRFSNISNNGNIINNNRIDFNFRPESTRSNNIKVPDLNNRIFNNEKEIQLPINFKEEKLKEQNYKNNNHFQYLLNTPQVDTNASKYEFFDFRSTATR